MAVLLSTVRSQLDDDRLHTFLCEAAAIINSRFLSVYNLADPDNCMPISPSNFLTMKPRTIFIVERGGEGYNTYQTSSG